MLSESLKLFFFGKLFKVWFYFRQFEFPRVVSQSRLQFVFYYFDLPILILIFLWVYVYKTVNMWVVRDTA